MTTLYHDGVQYTVIMDDELYVTVIRHRDGLSEVVADEGYWSGDCVVDDTADLGEDLWSAIDLVCHDIAAETP